MFLELCGPEAYNNVVVLTTFWDEVPTDEGIEREAQFKSNGFANLAKGGAEFMRHDHTVESARTVLRHILPMPPTILQIQTEMGIDGLSLIETAVGSELSKEIEKNLAKYKERIVELTAEMTVKKGDKVARQRLETHLAGLRNSLATWEREYAELKKGLH
jgi:hypothetical protein